jgi:putative acetyltransferase
MTKIDIRDETISDHDQVRAIHLAAFPSSEEATLVDLLRQQGHGVCSLVAEYEGQVVGHIMFSKLEAPEKSLALAPVAVLPNIQQTGIGSSLIYEGIAQTRSDGWRTIFVLGEPGYYQRFGFSLSDAKPYPCEYAGDYFMALHIGEAAPVAEVVYPAPFQELG